RGDFSGNALVFMEVQSAVMLLDMLRGDSISNRDLSNTDRDAMLEICNILLNAYVGSFANLLKVGLNFSVPVLCEDSLNNVLSQYEINPDVIHYTLLVKTEFHFENRSISGYVILIVGISSLRDLFSAIEKISN
ncbi:MAG: hypothetical protein LWX83_16730, partial [Anaerolineae bacterium]|nr:hypothetical protein [Anaerolineae bacterium]